MQFLNYSMVKWSLFHWKSYSCTLFEKSNFCPKIQFWQNPNIFTSFSPKLFLTIFSWNQSCQQLKSLKPQHFHEFFTKKKIDNFLEEIQVEFLDKKWRFRTEACDIFPNFLKIVWLVAFLGQFQALQKMSSAYNSKLMSTSLAHFKTSPTISKKWGRCFSN